MGSPAKEASVGKLARVCLKLAFAPIILPARLYLVRGFFVSDVNKVLVALVFWS